MDKIKKKLSKIPSDIRKRIILTFFLIENNQENKVGVKKLKKEKDVYRVRVGRYRIFFIKTDKSNKIIDIRKRDTKTYKK